MGEWVTQLGIPKLAAIAAVGVIAVAGFNLVFRLPKDHPLSPYAMQCIALIVIMAITALLALENVFVGEVPTVVGTIVGFFFGHAVGIGRAGPGVSGPASHRSPT